MWQWARRRIKSQDWTPGHFGKDCLGTDPNVIKTYSNLHFAEINTSAIPFFMDLEKTFYVIILRIHFVRSDYNSFVRYLSLWHRCDLLTTSRNRLLLECVNFTNNIPNIIIEEMLCYSRAYQGFVGGAIQLPITPVISINSSSMHGISQFRIHFRAI